jgi:hypothetical protein
MLADVAGANRSQHGVCDCVRKDISIGMSFQPTRVRNLNAAQNQFSSLRETMNVVTDAAANHGFALLRRGKTLNR